MSVMISNSFGRQTSTAYVGLQVLRSHVTCAEMPTPPNVAAGVTVCDKKLQKGGMTTAHGGNGNKISKIHHAMESTLVC